MLRQLMLATIDSLDERNPGLEAPGMHLHIHFRSSSVEKVTERSLFIECKLVPSDIGVVEAGYE